MMNIKLKVVVCMRGFTIYSRIEGFVWIDTEQEGKPSFPAVARMWDEAIRDLPRRLSHQRPDEV